MEAYYQNLLMKALKATQGKLQVSDTVPNSVEALTVSTDPVPFGHGFDHAIADIDIQATIRKPSSTGAIKNLFTTFEGKSSSGHKGRLGTYYGIQELTYSDRDGSDVATITATDTLTHGTFSWGDDVVAWDMLIISGLDPVAGTNVGVRKVLSGSGTAITTHSGLGTTTNAVDASVLRLNPVELFAVPSPNGEGQEQLFLTVDPSSDALTNADYLSNLGLLNQHRIYPLIPPRLGDLESTADGIFNRISDLEGTGASDLFASEWGFRLVLYPALSNGTGPDLTKPIGQNPIIDSTVVLDEQDVFIDYANGTVYFTVPPRLGDDINPNSYGGPIRLWAVFVAYSLETEIGSSVVHNVSRQIVDMPSGSDPVYDNPSYLKYNGVKKLWNVYSGTGALKSAVDQPIQGFEFGDDVVEEPLKIIWDHQNGRWEVCSSPTTTADYQELFLYSGVSGGQNPGLSVKVGGTEYGIRFDSDLNWNLNSGLILDQGAGDNPILRLKSSDIDHGMTSFQATDIYGAFNKGNGDTGTLLVEGFSEDSIGVSIQSFSVNGISTTGTGSDGAITLRSRKKSGSATMSFNDGDNLLVISNDVISRLIVKGNGDIYISGAYANYDNESDAMACQDMAYELSGLTDKILTYNRKKLESIGVMENGFIHLNNMVGLQLGAIGEVFKV